MFVFSSPLSLSVSSFHLGAVDYEDMSVVFTVSKVSCFDFKKDQQQQQNPVFLFFLFCMLCDWMLGMKDSN